jgi:predicted nuclease of predicted toxin-antitoxin system
LKLLLDEMYPRALADALRDIGIDSCTVSELGLAGRSDLDLFETAIAQGYAVLTENVSDFAQICAEHVTAGHHHPGVLIALSTRFSRRPSGRNTLITAIRAISSETLDDRLVYLQRACQE